jgi:hypothetical protein
MEQNGVLEIMLLKCSISRFRDYFCEINAKRKLRIRNVWICLKSAKHALRTDVDGLIIIAVDTRT